MIAGTYKSNRPINVTGIDKVHSKCDCINGSVVNGVQRPIIYSFGVSSLTGQKLYKEPRIKLLEKIEPVLSHITFYLEADGHKPVDFSDEIISFTC